MLAVRQLIEKKNKAEAIGAAVFEKDKMVGELGEVETEICKILEGDYTYSYLTYYNNDTPDIPITVKTTQDRKSQNTKLILIKRPLI